MSDVLVHRLDLGYFLRPGTETTSGRPRTEPCLAYLVVHPGGVLLLDTGMGSHPDVDARYQPRRVPLQGALARLGLGLADITLVANCHLHFDHCGGNPLLAGRPFLVQAAELAAARGVADYTLPELVDPPGTRWEVLEGEAEVLDGVLVVPTPGHTDGHQSLVVRGRDGVVVVAGQSHDTASDYAADALAWRAGQDDGAPHLPTPPAWVGLLQRLDPARVVFAHDHAVWVP